MANFINSALNVVMTTHILLFKTKRTLCIYNITIRHACKCNVAWCIIYHGLAGKRIVTPNLTIQNMTHITVKLNFELRSASLWIHCFSQSERVLSISGESNKLSNLFLFLPNKIQNINVIIYDATSHNTFLKDIDHITTS